MNASKHETKHCPRCETLFTCRVGDVLQCQCMDVPLSAEEAAYLQEQYDDCLCAPCMRKLKQAYHQQRFRQQLRRMFGQFGPQG